MAHLTRTVNGNIVSFKSPCEAPIQNIKVYFNPQQSGTGDPSPSNIRSITGYTGINVIHCGKNLINFNDTESFDWGYYKSNGDPSRTSSDLYEFTDLRYYPLPLDKRMTISTKGNMSLCSASYDKDKKFIKRYINNTAASNFTIGENSSEYYIRASVCPKPNTKHTSFSEFATNDEIQLELGSVATTYEPYHGKTINITFPPLGKNLINIGTDTFTKYKKYVLDTPLPAGTYTVSGTVTSNDTDSTLCCFNFADENDANIKYVYFTRGSRYSETITLTKECHVIFLYASNTYNKSVNDTVTWTEVQVESGSTLTTYEPYTNTAYRGNVDLVTGVLTVTHAYMEYDGSSDEYWGVQDYSNDKNFFISTPSTFKRSTDVDNFYCNVAKPISSLAVGTAKITASGFLNVCIGSYINVDTVENFKAWLSEHHLQMVSELVTPITYQLSPIQLKTLKGQNNIWSDIGQTEVIYDLVETVDMIHIRNMILRDMMIYTLPSQYQKVNYLQGNGSNARIDTGISGNDNTLIIDCAFKPIELITSYQGIFGNYRTENDHYCWRCISYPTSSNYFYSAFYVTMGNGSPGGGGTGVIQPCGKLQTDSAINCKIKLHIEYGTATAFGTVESTVTKSNMEKTINDRNIAIGASSPVTTGGASIFRFYEFKFHSHNKLIRYYVPCYRKSDNKAGFYDLVNHTFNPSIGSADFIAGNDT